jgi:hypothetical protein
VSSTPELGNTFISRQDRLKDHLNKAQHKRAVAWLLRTAPAAAVTASSVSEQLIHIPGVPKDWAELLVAAGVRFSYAQLLAAANSMVAGAEVWVQAQHELGITTDIPKVAVAICCAADMQRFFLESHEAPVRFRNLR